MNYYVEIPYDKMETLQFPKICPFTLEANPQDSWELKKETKSKGFSIPAVPLVVVTDRRCLGMQIPVARTFVYWQYTLFLFSFLLFFIPPLLLWGIKSLELIEIPEDIIILSSLVGIITFVIKRVRQRHVWIDYVGKHAIDLVFKKKIYVEEFCEINNLTFKRKLINFHPK